MYHFKDEPALSNNRTIWSDSSHTFGQPVCVSDCVPGASNKRELVPGIAIIPTAIRLHAQPLMITYSKSIDTAAVSWSTPTGTLGESPFKAQLSHGASVVSKANSRRCWPPIRDTCVPSHLIEAGFPEKETTPEQYDKTNRFKGITTVFVIGTFFMVHGNCVLWGHFSFLKNIFFVRVQHSVVNVCESISSVFYWTSFCLGERTMTIGFQTFPNLITGLQKPQTMPWQACHLWSQAKVLLCFFSSPFFSFYPYEVKNKDIL